MPSDVLITPATSKIDFTDGANATKRLNISGTAFSFNSNLNVLSSTSLSSAFKAEGVNGTLFEVTDDLSNSLMSVNTIGGLPVFEVFANNSIIGGQYGANDFVISGNKIGLGYANPVNKLSVSGSVSIGSSYNVSAPSNGLIVQGNVGIGTISPTVPLDVQCDTGGTGIKLRGRSDNSTALRFYANNATTQQLYIGTDDSNIDFNSVSTRPIRFFVNSLIQYQINQLGVFSWYDGAGGTRMTLNSTGLGIGSTSPVALLNIRASAPTTTGGVTTGTNLLIDSNTSNYITFRNTADNGTYAGLVFLDNNVGGYITFRNYSGNVDTGSDCMIYGTYQDHIFQNGSSETINGKTETMRIKQNGYVGIGTLSPANKLAVLGSVSIGSGYNTAAPTNGLIVEGSVGIGNTNPTGKLQVTGDIRTLQNGSDSIGSQLYIANAANNRAYNFQLNSAGTNLALWGYNSSNAWQNLVNFNYNGNVGIGIIAPSATLHVNSTTSGATLLRADGTNGTLFSVIDDLSDSLMSVNNSAGLPVLEVFADDRVVAGQYGANDFVLVNNKLGLGTNNPQYELDIVGPGSNAAVNIITRIRSSASSDTFNTGSVIAFTNTTTNVNAYSYIGSRIDLGGAGDNAQALIFATNATNTLPTEKMRIKSDGNVGIGTTSPAYKLDVNGSVNLTGNINFTGSGEFYLQNAASTNFIGINTTSNYIRFATNNSIKVFIDSAGNLGIGTSSPADKLDVNGAVYIRGSNSLKLDNASNNYVAQIYNDGSSGTSTLVFNTGGSEKMRIINGGNVGIGTTSPAAKLAITADQSVYNNDTSQLIITGATSTSKRLILGYNTSTDKGFIQATNTAENYKDLLLNPNSGNVGIGTTSPATLLQIGTGTPTSATGGIQFGSDTNARIYRINASTIQVSNNLTVGGTITGNLTGNVTGTAGGETFATVTGRGSGTTTQISVGTTSAGSMFTGEKIGSGYSDNLSGATFKSITNHPTGASFAFASYYGGLLGTNSFYVSAEGGAYFKSNVGIGTTSPSQALHILTSNAGNNGLTIATTSATGNPQIRFLNSAGVEKAAITYASSADAVYFYTAASASNLMTFVGANVGIGTTSPATLLQIGTGTPSSATGGIQFGDDTGTRLYRSASGIITCSGTIAATFSGALTGNVTGNVSGSSGSCTGNAAGSSTFIAGLGSGLNYDIDRTTKRAGLSHYSGYSTGTNRPTTYDYTLQVTDGSKGWEISMDWIATTGPAIYARSLRDCCQNWSSWVRILDSANYSFAANMNQNVRTTDNVTFGTVTASLSGNATNVTGIVALANGGSGQTSAQAAMNAFAGAVTSGSYLRGNGTNVVMSAIQAADVPTLNQNTTGNAATASLATTSDRLTSRDNRTISPSSDDAFRLRYGFTSWANNNTSPYADYLHLRSYSDASGGNDNLVMFRKDAIGMRIYQAGFGTSVAYSSFKDVAFTDQSFFIGTTSIAINRASAALTLNGVNISGTAASETLGTVTGRGSSTTTQISVGTTSSGSMYTGIKSGAGYSDTVSGATFKSITDHPTGGSFAFAAYYNGAPGTGTNSFYVAANGGAYFAQGVGIGVTSPLQALHINGNIILDGTTNGYTQSTTRGIGYGSNNGAVSVDGFSGMDIQSVNAPAPNNGNYSQNLRFWTHHYNTGTGATPRMFLQYNGNLGIGTVSPTAKLNVLSTSSLSSVFKTEGVNGTLFEVTDDLSNSLMSVNTIGGLPVFEVFANNSIIAGQYGQNDFVISGNKVGIGTASPSSLLNVRGTGTLGSVFQEKITNGTTTLALGTNATAAEVQSQGSVPLYLNYGGNNVCVVPVGSGNVGIGTTSPTYKLQIGTVGSLADSIRIGTYQVAKNTRQYIGYTRDDSGLFESAGNGDTPSTVLGGVVGIRIVNTEGTLYAPQADNSVQILTHIYSGGSRVALHAHYDGNVGIGTVSPSAKLHVQTTAGSVTAPNVVAIFQANTDTTILAGGGTAIKFRGVSSGGNAQDYDQCMISSLGYAGNNQHGMQFWVKPNGGTVLTAALTINNDSSVVANSSVTAASFSGLGTNLTGTASSLTVGTATNSTQLGGAAASSYVRNDTDGTAGNVFSLITVTKSLILTTSWLDTGISGTSDLANSGAYIITMNADNYSVGGGQYNETYTGIMYWYAGGTNDAGADEIPLHKSGHAPNSVYINLRTLRTASGTLKLQIISSAATNAASNYIFKFRRMI